MFDRLKVNLFPLAAVFFLTGCCGCGFDHAWQAADHAPQGIAGRWQGTWKSQADGHSGELLCVIESKGCHNYDAWFKASFGGIFHFTYDATLTGRQGNSQIHLSGLEDLGWPLGMYQYEGDADPNLLQCAYRTDFDHGSFTLSRPGSAAAQTQTK